MIDGPDEKVVIRLYQAVNVIGPEGVAILLDTLCVRPGKKSAQSVLKWDILPMYAKPKLKKFPVHHEYSIYEWMNVRKRKTRICLQLLVRLKEENSRSTLGVSQWR